MRINLSYQELTEIPADINPAVTELHLSGNQITEIKNLDHFINLKTLYLDNNQITEIKNLDHLTNLNTLYLNDNQIIEITRTFGPCRDRVSENLDHLTNLQRSTVVSGFA